MNLNREELNALIRTAPILIRMNDGREFQVVNHEFATVSDFAIAVVHRADDGKLRHAHLPFTEINAVEPLPKT